MKSVLLFILFAGVVNTAIVGQVSSISGTFYYKNASLTPIGNVKVILKSGSVPVDSTFTSTPGHYQFTGLAGGTYTIEAFCSRPWAGVNGTDALKVRRHFTGMELLGVPVALSAADVNNSGSVNGTDALKIERRFVGLDSCFSRGNWTFEKVTGGNTILVAGTDVLQDFYGLCVGDVDGSYMPPPSQLLPTVTTADISGITQDSAVSGGTVISDGGVTVVARGVCWSISPNPTLVNSHTSDGSGTGTFVSSITGLEANTLYYARAYATNGVGTAYGNELAFTTLSSFICGQPFSDARDFKTYNTVYIGTQCWMAQNLNTGIRIDVSADQTNNEIMEKYCYDELESNCTVFGGLYQWNEVMNYTASSNTDPGERQGICPALWHIPSDAEWCRLSAYLDSTCNCSATGWQGSDAGGKMKETGMSHWAIPNTGASNASGFTGLPAGARVNFWNEYSNIYLYTFFWTSAEKTQQYAWIYELGFNSAQINRTFNTKNHGFSIRCVRD